MGQSKICHPIKKTILSKRTFPKKLFLLKVRPVLIYIYI